MNAKVFSQKIKKIYDNNDSGFHQRLLLLHLVHQVKTEFAKSLKKRSLYLNFYFYKFFFNSVKSKLVNSFYQNNLQFIKLDLFLPKSLFHKRMFFKNLDLNSFLETSSSKQFWINGIFKKNYITNKYFYKQCYIPTKFGTHVVFTKNIDFNYDNQKMLQVFKKTQKDIIDFNLNGTLTFDLFLLNVFDIYKICIYLFFIKLLK